MSAPIAPAGDDNVDTDELPALNRLEEALGDIDGVAQVLLSLVGKHDSLNAEATCYLGSRLREHYRMAHDAFSISRASPRRSLLLARRRMEA
jgi:hypothetical protein